MGKRKFTNLNGPWFPQIPRRIGARPVAHVAPGKRSKGEKKPLEMVV